MDFIYEQTAGGTALRVLSIVDLYTPESVGFVPAIIYARKTSSHFESTAGRARRGYGHSVRQPQRFHVGRARPVERLASGALGLQSTRQGDRQCRH